MAQSDVEFAGASDSVKTVYTNKTLTDIRKLVTEGYVKISRENNDVNIDGKVDDQKRIDYYFVHIQEIQTLLDKGYNIKSYFAWSLLDNYEWSFGYTKRFGLVYVDFETQKRIKKKSWFEFSYNLK